MALKKLLIERQSCETDEVTLYFDIKGSVLRKPLTTHFPEEVFPLYNRGSAFCD